MNQETYVKVQDQRKQGWTLEEIATETGFHPSTISERLKADGPPAKRQVPDSALVMNAFWKERIATLIGTTHACWGSVSTTSSSLRSSPAATRQ